MVDLTPWLRRTGWPTQFAGREMDILVGKAGTPTKGEKELLLVCKSVERLIVKRCGNGVLDCVLRNWSLILFWLSSSMTGISHKKPFRTVYQSDTIPRYMRLWQRLICLYLQSLGENERYGVDLNRNCVWRS